MVDLGTSAADALNLVEELADGGYTTTLFSQLDEDSPYCAAVRRASIGPVAAVSVSGCGATVTAAILNAGRNMWEGVK